MAWTCVFSKQSLPPALCDHQPLPQQVGSRSVAPLLPKLRGQFAEFLNHSSPDRLGILYLTTCVGLGYGPRTTSLEAFLGSIGSSTSPDTARRHVSPLYAGRIYLPDGLHAYPRTTTAWAGLPSCVTPSLTYYPVGPPAPPRPFVRRLQAGFTGLASRGSALALQSGYGNINPLSIDYACRPRLRSRLTLGRSA